MTDPIPASAPLPPAARRRPWWRVLATRAGLLAFSLALTWLLLEILLRVAFDALPAGVQGAIQSVRRYPWAEETIIPRPPFIIDRDFQVRMPPGLTDYPMRWGDATFNYTLISAWDGHRAGLRSDPPEWPLDIMTFGDSHTFCWVKWADCWVKQLRTEHGWHTFNAAIPGTGPQGQLALMKELVPPMKPKLVVWLWFPNDLSDDYDLARIRGETEEREVAPYPDPEAPLQGIAQYSAVWALIQTRVAPAPKVSPYQHFQEVLLNQRIFKVKTNEYPNPYALRWANNQYGLTRNLAAHAEAASFLQQNGGVKLLIVLMPVKEEAYAQQLTATLGTPYLEEIGGGRRALLDQCAALKLNCLDLTPSFQAATLAGKTVFLQFDTHLDASGNRLVGEQVASAIQQMNLLAGK